MDKRQSAVDWLVEQVFNDVDLKDSILKLAISQAKALEKEQIIDAYRDGRSDQHSKVPRFYNRNAIYYYNETYG